MSAIPKAWPVSREKARAFSLFDWSQVLKLWWDLRLSKSLFLLVFFPIPHSERTGFFHPAVVHPDISSPSRSWTTILPKIKGCSSLSAETARAIPSLVVEAWGGMSFLGGWEMILTMKYPPVSITPTHAMKTYQGRVFFFDFGLRIKGWPHDSQ